MRGVGIVLDDPCGIDAGHDIGNVNIVLSQLIVAMRGNAD